MWRFQALLVLMLASGPVLAATIQVTTTTDELTVNGQCSLREAVKAANTDSAVDSCTAGNDNNDTIELPAGTYTLSLTGTDVDDGLNTGFVSGDENVGDLDVTDNLTIRGADAATTIIDGNEIDRIFQAFASLIIEDLTLQNGRNSSNQDWGGCIRSNYASVGIHYSIIRDCYSALDGGAIYVYDANLNITHSRIESNTASDRGGAIAAYTGSTVTISDAVFSDNATEGFGGGAIYVSGYDSASTLGISRSSLHHNSAHMSGGAIYIYLGVGTLTESSITGNSAVAQGGGVYLESSTVNITNSTLSGNSGSNGAAAYARSGTLRMINSTIAFNERGTALNGYIGNEVRLKNSIVASNSAQLYPNLGGNYVSEGYNLIGQYSGTLGSNDSADIDPLLGPLTLHSNGVAYHPLLPGSPAIDGGNPGGCYDVLGLSLIMGDQLGNPRTVDGDNDATSRCDAGAIEAAFSRGLIITPVFDLLTTEQGNATVINVSLNSMPADDVGVSLSVSDSSEGELSTSGLTFTPLNWDTPQQVIITGVDDDIIDGEVSYQVITSVLTSSDADFNGIDPTDITVVNADDESAAVAVTHTNGDPITVPLEVLEAGGSPSTFFQIRLATRPVDDVTVYYRVASSDQGTFNPYGSGGGSAIIGGLDYYYHTFTPNTWDVPLQMPIYAVNELVDDGDVAFTVDFLPAVSNDLNYGARAIASIDVIAIDDDDPAPPSGSGGGGSGSGGGGGGGSMDWLLLAGGVLLFTRRYRVMVSCARVGEGSPGYKATSRLSRRKSSRMW